MYLFLLSFYITDSNSLYVQVYRWMGSGRHGPSGLAARGIAPRVSSLAIATATTRHRRTAAGSVMEASRSTGGTAGPSANNPVSYNDDNNNNNNDSSDDSSSTDGQYQ